MGMAEDLPILGNGGGPSNPWEEDSEDHDYVVEECDTFDLDCEDDSADAFFASDWFKDAVELLGGEVQCPPPPQQANRGAVNNEDERNHPPPERMCLRWKTMWQSKH